MAVVDLSGAFSMHRQHHVIHDEVPDLRARDLSVAAGGAEMNAAVVSPSDQIAT